MPPKTGKRKVPENRREQGTQGSSTKRRQLKPSEVKKLQCKRLVQDIDQSKHISFSKLKESKAWATASSEPPFKPEDISDCIWTFATYAASKGKSMVDKIAAFTRWKTFKENIRDTNTKLSERDDELAIGLHYVLSGGIKPGSEIKSGKGKL